MNCIIIDDEAASRAIISHFCSSFNNISVIEEFPNAIQAIKFLNQNEAALIKTEILLCTSSSMDDISLSMKIFFTSLCRDIFSY